MKSLSSRAKDNIHFTCRYISNDFYFAKLDTSPFENDAAARWRRTWRRQQPDLRFVWETPSFHSSFMLASQSVHLPLALSSGALCHALQTHATLNYQSFEAYAGSFRCIYILCCSAMHFASNLLFVKSTLSINLTSLDTQY